MTGDRRWSSGKFRAASLIDCNWSARHVQLDTTEEAKAKADRLGTEEWRRGSKPREPREWVSGRWRRQLCANYRLMRRTIATVRTVSLCLSLPLFLWFKDVCQRHFWAGVNWIPVQVRWWWMGSRLWLHTGLTTSFSTVLLSHSLQPYLSLSFWLCAFDLSRWKIKVAHTFVMDNELQECNWGVSVAVGVGAGVVVSITCWTIKRSAH